MDKSIRTAGDMSSVKVTRVKQSDPEALAKADEGLTACLRDCCADIVKQVDDGILFNSFVVAAQQRPKHADSKGVVVITAMGGNSDSITALSDQTVLMAMILRLQASKKDSERIPCSYLVEAMSRLELAKRFSKVDGSTEAALLQAVLDVKSLVYHDHDDESEVPHGCTIQ